MTTETTRPLALVTGASSGIGLELSKQFADHGFDLVVAAEDGGLNEAIAELRRRGAEVQDVHVDLSTGAGVDELYARVRDTGRPLQAAALNAGIGAGGGFADAPGGGKETDLEQELRLVDLNVRSTVHLAKYVARDMRLRGEGRILFTSSIASTMPGPYQAVYNASKSFVQSFALALRSELRGTGVTVTSLMPGPTATDFFRRAGLLDTKLGTTDAMDDPADVARDGFDALMEGRERVVSHSLMTKLQGYGDRFIPEAVKAELHKLMAKPGSAS